MTRITKEVYLYTPDPETTSSQPPPTSSVPPPKLILLSSWMGAGDKHIAKYLTRYQALYPTSPILLIKSEPKHVVIPSRGKAITAPAVPIIRSLAPAPSPSDLKHNRHPVLLIHLFSNAGSAVKNHLYDLFAETAPAGGGGRTTRDEGVLPPHVTVFDSTPGEATYTGSILAFSSTVPPGWRRTLALPLVHLLMMAFWVWYIVPGKDILKYWGDRHNDKGLAGGEVRRTYVYSEEDVTIPWKGVERHAARATENGFEARLEKFGGSLHVAHMVRDPERYWRVVRETWEGRG